MAIFAYRMCVNRFKSGQTAAAILGHYLSYALCAVEYSVNVYCIEYYIEYTKVYTPHSLRVLTFRSVKAP